MEVDAVEGVDFFDPDSVELGDVVEADDGRHRGTRGVQLVEALAALEAGWVEGAFSSRSFWSCWTDSRTL